ncbi:MAG: tetratricopeptide repeat protein [Candidatus Thermoplasmatota archaeon]|nr:tetratricopeptide repeat protein [Candidatus Thermoplasmatota archaeon]
MVRKGYGKGYYTKKYLLQISERIVLFLDNHVGIYDQAELPLTLTQSGIADALEIRRSQVSQVIGGLVESEFISGELRHVQRGKRRRLCYFLTSRGMDRAREIETGIGGGQIELLNAPGGKRTVRLREIPTILADGSTLLDIVTHTRKSAFDVAEYQKRRMKKRKPVASGLPMLHRFFGRRKELTRVESFLSSKEQRILAIRGIAGIGKSTLAAKVMKKSKGKTNLFYYQLKDWTTLRGLLLSLSKVLSELERNDLKFYLDSNKEIDLDEVGLIVEDCLRGLDGMIVLDDCQFARGNVLNFLESAKGFLGASNGFKMIVLGRQIPPFYDTRDVSVKKHVVEMELGGLSARDCREFLSSRKLPKAEFDEIIKKTEGHPLFLELVDSSAQVVAGDVKRFLRQEIASKLSEKERAILSIASVFRERVSTSALFAEEKLDHGMIDSLVSQSLLSEGADEKYVMHDALKEFFYGQLSEPKRSEYHRQAGEYYSDFSDPESVLEAQYHLVKGGLFERAAELMTLHGESLISEGFSEDLLEILEAMEDSDTWGSFVTDIHLLRGRMLSLTGRWKEAIEDFKEAERISAKEGDLGLALEAASHIGEIMRRQGQSRDSLEIFQRAEKEINERTDVSVTTRVFRNLAMLYADQTDFDRGYEYLGLMDDSTSEHPDRSERSDYLATKGSILSLQNLREEAMEAWKQAVGICEGNHDVLRLPNVYNGLGVSLYSLEKNDLALEYFNRAIKFAQRIGDLRGQGILLLNTASIYIEKPDLSRAERYLDSAMEIFNRLEEKKNSALVELSLAFVGYRRGESDNASSHIQRHLVQIKEHGAPADIMDSFKRSGELYREMGMVDRARMCFETAISISEQVGKPIASLDRLQEPKGTRKLV